MDSRLLDRAKWDSILVLWIRGDGDDDLHFVVSVPIQMLDLDGSSGEIVLVCPFLKGDGSDGDCVKSMDFGVKRSHGGYIQLFMERVNWEWPVDMVVL